MFIVSQLVVYCMDDSQVQRNGLVRFWYQVFLFCFVFLIILALSQVFEIVRRDCVACHVSMVQLV